MFMYHFSEGIKAYRSPNIS